ncbi:MAG: RsmB/NOP family class I SAM-dependent RNA methyltransferase [Bacteroides acidifaciens]|uniref:methyltransferase RsmF C-terminal domain-like protein n=1 Tax=Bacteroides acidifaciens TaxID=85831 RepID=UPI0023BFBE06|nr:rRNA cytosine-C5-methyltransferase [Bacteroides acidifaciens]MDE6821932.1 RsmB/NOP family class I SAM-dependent RNA methyltransferase [Bacteroides acidifaciens]MDE6987533.1 RsmB/NOP family class I SAM-dependent RNA methyltransferase [Bacteroides acidifaciens]
MDLPASFTAYTRSLLGDEEYDKLAAAIQQEPPVSIRLNKLRMDSPLLPVPWASEGFYLDERLTFTFDPLFHAGCYYVQEASSMFVEQVLRQYVTEPVVMLDLCAAPGGKSTHARSVLPEGSLLVANEVIRNRSQILAENLTKWGHPDVVVTNNDPADFSSLLSFFDVILTDVPCSGEGMFRKDPVAVEEWSPENVEICWQRQRRIIADIWPSLKPGGILIYSTCTYNTKEDEENVHWIQQEFGAEPLALEIREDWNITGNLLYKESDNSKAVGNSEQKAPVYHFFPHKTKGEGFFLAALRKPETEEDTMPAFSSSKNKAAKKKDKKGGATPSPVSKEHLNIAKNWLNEEKLPGYIVSAEGTKIQAFPQQYVDELAAMKQSLKIVSAGVGIGEVKGKDLIPDHALAMSSVLLRQGAFATEDITYEQAIAYLRKEAIALPATAPRGYILLTYRNIPLGFVKNIGNRANNLYPQEWRIRSGYLPDEIKTL